MMTILIFHKNVSKFMMMLLKLEKNCKRETTSRGTAGIASILRVNICDFH